jgi:hypothetical protein
MLQPTVQTTTRAQDHFQNYMPGAAPIIQAATTQYRLSILLHLSTRRGKTKPTARTQNTYRDIV